jgi:hypothetical protein
MPASDRRAGHKWREAAARRFKAQQTDRGDTEPEHQDRKDPAGVYQDKLNLHSVAEIVRYRVRTGIVQP